MSALKQPIGIGCYNAYPRGVTTLRDAVKILIGAGAGCDEADDEPDETAAPKLRKLQEDYLERHGLEAIQKAAAIVYGKK